VIDSSPVEVSEALSATRDVWSLDYTYDENANDTRTLYDFVSDDYDLIKKVDDYESSTSLREAIAAVYETLTPNEQHVMQMTLLEDNDLSQQEIADTLGISQGGVSRYKKRVINILKIRLQEFAPKEDEKLYCAAIAAIYPTLSAHEQFIVDQRIRDGKKMLHADIAAVFGKAPNYVSRMEKKLQHKIKAAMNHVKPEAWTMTEEMIEDEFPSLEWEVVEDDKEFLSAT